MQQLLPMSLDSMVSPESEQPSRRASSTGDDVEALAQTATKGVDAGQRGMLSQKLKKLVKALPGVYAGYTSEIVWSRAHPTTLEPVIKAIKTIRRNPLLGSAGHTPGERIKAALDRSIGLTPPPSAQPSMVDLKKANAATNSFPAAKNETPRSRDTQTTLAIPPWILKEVQSSASSTTSLSALAEPRLAQSCRDVGDSICAAWAAAWTRLRYTYNWDRTGSHTASAKTDPIAIQAEIRAQVQILEKELAILLEMADTGADAIDRGRARSRARFEKPDYKMAFYMTALMDLARETSALLTLVESQAATTKRCYVPWLFWPLDGFVGKAPVKEDPTEHDEKSEPIRSWLGLGDS